MIFLSYALSAFVTYALLSPVYFYELWRATPLPKKKRWVDVLLLCSVKALDWGLCMELDERLGALAASIISSIVFYGFQEWVDRRIKNQNVTLSVKLWKRSFFGLTGIVDSWIHLSLFNYLQDVLPNTALYVALAGATGHVIGMAATYPFVSMRRKNNTYFEGFILYFVRSTVAVFLISFLAESFFYF